MNAAADEALGRILTGGGAVDPYPLYKRIRENAPIFKSSMGLWVVSGYDDCRSVLRDARFGKDWAGYMESSGNDDWREQPSLQYGEQSLLFSNPPDHTRLRRLVSKAFTPRRVERLRSKMRGRIDALLTSMEHDGGGDIMDALAFPLPVAVIGDLLGVPQSDWHDFRQAVRKGTRTLELSVSKEHIAEANVATVWMSEYFAALISEKRKRPDAGMISAMLAVEEDGDRLTELEVSGLSGLLFAAGFETTTNLIGNGLRALLKHPDQLEALRDNPELCAGAVEECLRFDPSIHISTRSAFEDADVGGVPVAKGETVLTLLAAANRDPSRISDPDRFDIARKGIEPMSFGSGIHYCLGASLARAEAQETFNGLLARFPVIEMTDEPQYRDQMAFRGLESLNVRCLANARTGT